MIIFDYLDHRYTGRVLGIGEQQIHRHHQPVQRIQVVECNVLTRDGQVHAETRLFPVISMSPIA